MDPSQFNGPGYQAAPGILQWLARMFGGNDRPGPQMASTGTPATQSPPTRSGIGVLPGAEPFQPASEPQMGAGMSFTPPLPEPMPAPSYDPLSSISAPLRSSLESLVRPPIPRQKPVMKETRPIKVVDDRPKPKAKPAKKWTAKDAYNRRQAERGGAMRMK
jgi:hypothetical protein